MRGTSSIGHRPVLTALLVAVVALVGATLAAPARADGADSSTATVAALDSLHLLAADDGVTGRLAPDTGVLVGTGDRSVALRPETDAPGRLVDNGAAVIYGDAADDYTYAVTGEGSAANAGYVVLHDSTAPDEFRFEISGTDEPVVLEAADDGTVLVKDSAGELLNALHAPWAVDASGRSLSTTYQLDGNVVVQHIDHRGAAYPVVADPRLACDLLWCTLELTRTETTIVSQGGGAAVACAGLGPAAPICVTLLVGSAAMASIALANKKCIGVRSARALIPSTTHLVYVSCYA